ncbi:MAG: BamA/TamA family outer membrane protein [Bacteroidales bacterium]|nr:BamA/TamA family outer membrane protein [Bacteroidales bacterium]
MMRMLRFRLFLPCLLLLSAPALHGQRDTLLKTRLILSDTLQASGIRLPKWNPPYSAAGLEQFAEEMLVCLENHGHPFAEVRLLRPDSTRTTAVQVIANPFIRWDSIVLKGDLRLSPRFLYPYLKIKRGQPYRESAVKQAAEALQGLPYAEAVRQPSPSFTSDAAALYLYLNKRPANLFDGFAGFGTDASGKGLTLYGQLLFQLHNALGHGEFFSVDWKHPQPEDQQLVTKTSYPCLFGTAFGLYGEFSLLKKDSSYHKVSIPAGFRYLLKGNDFLQIYYRYERCHTPGTAAATPDQTDYRSDTYGLRYEASHTDRPRIPHKGYRIGIQGELGIKKESGGSGGRTVGRTTGEWEGFLPMFTRWTLYSRLCAGAIADAQPAYSDLFLLGGLRSLRGLEEQSLPASAYAILTEEIRFFIDKNMFLQLFADGGWYERQLPGGYSNGFPVGCGIGFSFDSKVGLLSLNYAVAAHDGQGFQLRAAKVCVGYSAVF